MKKEGLRRRLALCILETLGRHKITLPNVKRYVTPHLLTYYTIRYTTPITDQDIRIAIDMINKAIRNHSNPIPFRSAPSGSLWSQEREEIFLRAPLTDLI